MIKSRLVMVALVVGVSAGLVYAQQDKQSDKPSRVERQKDEAVAQSEFNAFALSLGEGGYIGIYLEEVTPERVKELGLREERGAIVMKVMEGGPAEKAGFKENDVIISFNGHRVDTVREMQRMLSETPAGRTVSVEVLRGGSLQTLTATLGKRSGNLNAMGRYKLGAEARGNLEASLAEESMKRAQADVKRAQEQLKKRMNEWGDFNFVAPGGLFRGGRLGVTIESLTPQLAEYFGVKDGHGALITEVQDNKAGAKGGLKAGDVITAVDGRKVDDLGSVMSAIAQKEEGQLSLTIVRNKKEQTISVTLEKRNLPQPPRPARRAVSRTRSV
jgi:serine protease Do